jgi:hypothetical protein
LIYNRNVERLLPIEKENEMTRNEAKLVSELLKIASDKLSRHSCNDVDSSIFGDMSKIELQNLAMEIEKCNGTPEDYDPDYDASTYEDWILMDYFANKIKAEW